MVLKEKLLAAAVTVAISITSPAFAVNKASFVVNQPTKQVIQTPHFYQKASDHPGGYGSNSIYMCSHAALKSALSTFGVNKTLSQIHDDLKRVDKNLNFRWDYAGKDPKVCPWGYCPHITLMKELLWQYDRDGLGVSGAYESVGNATAFANRMKQIISEGKVAVVLSGSYNFGQSTNYGHWYVIHGYRVEQGKTYFYVRDPLKEYGGEHTDSHDYSADDWWKWMNRNGNIQFLRVGLR